MGNTTKETSFVGKRSSVLVEMPIIHTRGSIKKEVGYPSSGERSGPNTKLRKSSDTE